MQTKRTFAVFLSIATLAATLLPLTLVAGQGRVSSPIADQSTTPDGPQGKIVKSYRVTPDGVEANKTSSGKQGNRTKPKEILPDWVNEALQRSLAHFAQRKGALRVDNPATDLKLLDVDQDDLGKTHVRLDQYHQGVEVFGGQVISHIEAGSVADVSGRLFEVGQIETTPSLNPVQAIEAAKAALGYSGEFANPPTVKLVVLPNSMIKGDEATGATLTYQVELYIEDGTDATAHHQYFVSAIDGSIVWRFNSLPTTTGSGHSLYSGTVRIPTTYDPGGFGIYSLKNSRNDTRDMKSNSTGGGDTFARFFIDEWGDGTTNNRESAAVDAHYGAIKTLDYFLNIHGRSGMDGKGTAVVTKVHFGSNHNNAYGNSTEVTFGDGDGSLFSPLVSMDVVAHEITHGVTAHTARLVYANESGALNESFSDIFGTAVEVYDGRKQNYLIGEDCYTPAIAGDAMRSMADPTLYGDPDHYANRYTGTDDNGGVHSNSGIMNKAFYLLASGGIHPYSRVQVPAIGNRAAERIFYRALSVHLTRSSGFVAARNATLAAATDLYGTYSLQSRATELAWDAVGVGRNRFDVALSAAGNDIALTGPPDWWTAPVAATNGDGTFNVTNHNLGDFAKWSSHGPARKLTGDFNGDGRTDIAMTGPGDWWTLPVAFSDGNGSFAVTNHGIGDFAKWAAQGATVVTGDFNGDGKTDIALTGVSGWWTVPVAFSRGDGTFYVTNHSIGDFARWAAYGSTVVTGDFNGDGRTDIALTGPGDWWTLPVAFSNGNGTFTVTNHGVGDFAKWSAHGATKLVGDFNGDGLTDIALTGPGDWWTLPVAFSNGNGSFRITNYDLPDFAKWAANGGTRKITGDFNADGRTDIALTGPADWTTLPIAFTNGNGSFDVTNRQVGDFAKWVAQGATILAGDFNRDGRTDLALTGVPGWWTLPVAFSNGVGDFRVTNQSIGEFANWAAYRRSEPGKVTALTGNFAGQ